MFSKSRLLILCYFCSLSVYGNTIASLKADINALLASKKATVGVSIWGQDASEILSVNGDTPLPMQSVFKYHLAVAVLQQVDQGKWSLADEITVTSKDLDNGLWSPIRKQYPEGTVLSLAEILRYTVAVSDNVGCDILIKMMGGPNVIETFFHQAGIQDIAIKYNEETMQMVWQRQYENWTTANAANLALHTFYENRKQQLSTESHRFLWNVMKNAQTGRKTIRAGVPKDTVVAHKTGHSGKNEAGLTGAQNDIGILFLPHGEHYYLSIMVSDSLEESHVNQSIISDISSLTWQFFNKRADE